MKILGIGNAIVDVICKVEDSFITNNGLTKSTMKLVDEAEFKMLFGGEKNTYPAVISIFTSVCMTLISVVPFFWSYADLTLSIYAFILILILGGWFTKKSFNLYKETTDESAKNLMLASFAYLPLMQIIYVLDNFFL